MVVVGAAPLGCRAVAGEVDLAEVAPAPWSAAQFDLAPDFSLFQARFCYDEQPALAGLVPCAY
jgi:hypothetical protein